MKDLDKLIKSLKELNEELKDIDREFNKKLSKEDIKRVKKEANELMDKAEDVILVLTNDGAVGSGSPVNILAAISCFLEKLKEENKIPTELLRMIFADLLDVNMFDM